MATTRKERARDLDDRDVEGAAAQVVDEDSQGPVARVPAPLVEVALLVSVGQARLRWAR